MSSFSQTQRTYCKRWSLECVALTGTQPCTVFGCKDFCGSTALSMPEPSGMNGQIDWQAQQISHLVCSLAEQRCSEAWWSFWTWTGQSMTALIAWRKEEWRKEAAGIPTSEVGNDLCSTRQTLALFREQPWGDCWETGRSAIATYGATLSWNWNLQWIPCHCYVLGASENADWLKKAKQKSRWIDLSSVLRPGPSSRLKQRSNGMQGQAHYSKTDSH